MKVRKVLALAAKGAPAFVKSHSSCGCCSPGIPWLQIPLASLIQPFSARTGESSTSPVAIPISNLMLGRALSVQAAVNILHMAEGNQSLFHPICHSRVTNSSHWYLLVQLQGAQMTQESLQILKAVAKAPVFA